MKFLFIFLMSLSFNSLAAEANLSYLYGTGFKTGEHTRDTIRFDTSKVSEKGLLFARADLSSFDNKSSLINTRIIGQYLTGVHPSVQLQNSNNVSYTGVGLGYSSFSKNFSYFVDTNYTLTSLNVDAIQLFAYAKYKLSESFFLDGFIDNMRFFSGANTTHTQFGINYKYDDCSFGLEQHIYLNKNRVDSLDESLLNLKVKYTF